MADRGNSGISDSVSNFDALPDSAIIRQPAVEGVLSISSSTLWRLARRGVLRPVKLSARVTGWRVGTVRAYLASLSAEVA